jgi:hypothetical protein
VTAEEPDVSALRVSLEAPRRGPVTAAEIVVVATVTNIGDWPAPFHRAQAEHASLVLQVEDESERRVLLPPPSPPDERDLAPPAPLDPGESITMRYTGFLGTQRHPGRYRVRWFSPHAALGGLRDAPLASDWLELDLAPPPTVARESPVLDALLRPWRYGLSIGRLLVAIVTRRLCRAVLEREVDVYVTETITNGYPESWNGTYAWNARFHVRVDQPQQRVVVTIRARLVGTAPVQAWVNVVESAWSNRFKDCATLGCASNGYRILLALEYVASGEHYALHLASSRTTDMLHWGLADGDQAHEAGHMLGNEEEYFTVDGVDYGAARKPNGNIMNNPDNPPVASHYRLIQSTVDALLGISYSLAGGSTRPVDVPCSLT